MAQTDEYWNKAKEAAVTDEQLANLKRSEISWRYWKANANRGEFSFANPYRSDEKQRLFDDLIRSGVKRMSEGQTAGDYMDCIAAKFVLPDDWDDYEKDDLRSEFASFFYNILELFVPLLTAFGIPYYAYRDLQKTVDFSIPGSLC